MTSRMPAAIIVVLLPFAFPVPTLAIPIPSQETVSRALETAGLTGGSIVAGLALLLWFFRIWRRERQNDARNTAVLDACADPANAQSAETDTHAALVRYAMAATGADRAYLVLFQPDPIIVCHGHGTTITLRDAPDAPPMPIALAAREFWAPLLEGAHHVSQHSRNAESENAGYPLSSSPVRHHLATAFMRRRTPLAILGVARTSGTLSDNDLTRLNTLLQARWHFEMLKADLKECRNAADECRAVFRASPFGHALLNDRGEILECNAAFRLQFGLRQSFRGRSFFGLVQGEARYQLEDAASRLLHAGGSAAVLESPVTTENGTQMLRMSLSRIAVDVEFRLLMVSESITESARIRQELEDYRARLEEQVVDRTLELKSALLYAESTRDRMDMILRSMADGLLVTDMHNRIMLMNRNAEAMLGITLHDTAGTQLGQALHHTPFRRHLEERVAQTRTGQPGEFEFSTPDAEGRGERYLRATSSQVRDGSRTPTGVVTVLHDITRERELEIMKSEFITMAAHELRTPLTTIRGFSEVLISRRDISEEERQRFLEHMSLGAQTLESIVDDLLDLSRMESGRGFTLNRKPLDIVEATRTLADIWRIRCETRNTGHTFAFSATREQAIALADKDKYAQLLENIISNAVKYSPSGGEITITVESDDAIILVTVTDHGLGMSKEQQERAFDKFFRAHNEDGGIQGTGLGLPIVRHLVQAHGGEVWLESKPGTGTQVSFTLPTEQVAMARSGPGIAPER